MENDEWQERIEFEIMRVQQFEYFRVMVIFWGDIYFDTLPVDTRAVRSVQPP